MLACIWYILCAHHAVCRWCQCACSDVCQMTPQRVCNHVTHAKCGERRFALMNSLCENGGSPTFRRKKMPQHTQHRAYTRANDERRAREKTNRVCTHTHTVCEEKKMRCLSITACKFKRLRIFETSSKLKLARPTFFLTALTFACDLAGTVGKTSLAYAAPQHSSSSLLANCSR